MIKRFLAFAMVLLLTGCAAKQPIHPGAVNAPDSYAYDSLTVAQTLITSARTDYLAGNLPPASKKPINDAVTAYNAALTEWNAYHSGVTKDATALNQAIALLTGAVSAIVQLKTNAPPAPTKPVGLLRFEMIQEVA